ncbi:DUF1003 domain-containing protein [Schauerella aestuarii]|uniref:DUF1003 domain-containing protein n=1 Tax=Schauerella aestuarii TaxID=2511204 RepID=UPI00136C4065|nr:DUF1003 domain-containing protein [Achromobacter aestuarii]MYZ43190.1 DUF1003 domain-containing protein [Achromobacter aestuarii]
MTRLSNDGPPTAARTSVRMDPLRFHRRHAHLSGPFGVDAFALKAEKFARFFGTPLFLGAQTLVVAVWIAINMSGATRFDPYPFILLNLAFSLQAAYSAPLILLAQTRQAARDAAHAEADAQHREALAIANAARQDTAEKTAAQLMTLLQQNTHLTEMTQALTQRVASLTAELHAHVIGKPHQTV